MKGLNLVALLHIALLLMFGLEKYCSGLRLLQLRVPEHKLQAGTANLRCIFDLHNSTLYAVKWYKDGAEFYRYAPADSPPGQSFPLPGVTVDVYRVLECTCMLKLEQSGQTRVILRLLTLESSGVYRCEVSTEAPHFLTVSAHSHMLIMELPREFPRISGLAEVYSDGEPIDVNCTSARSMPATDLAWFINDKEVKDMTNSETGPWQTQYLVRQGPDKLEEVTLGLRMAAHRRFLVSVSSGVMNLRCTATLGALQWHTRSSALVTSLPSAASVTHSMIALPLFWCILLLILSSQNS